MVFKILNIRCYYTVLSSTLYFTHRSMGPGRLKFLNELNRCIGTSSGNSTVKLSYAVFNPKTSTSGTAGSPLVFLHGLFGSKRNWESIAKVLSDRLTRRVITVDARNHGDSPHHDVMNYHVMSEDVRDLIQDLGLGKIVLVGHSMGGKTAMTLALTKPELIDELIIEDIAPARARSTNVSGFPEYIKAMMAVHFNQQLESISHVRKAVGAQIANTFPEKPLRDFILTNIDRRDGQYCWRINLAAIEAGLDDIIGYPHLTTSYEGRTLFVGGQNSPLISEPYYPEIRRLFPSAVIRHMSGAGHWAHSEKPQEFIDYVANFVQQKSF